MIDGVVENTSVPSNVNQNSLILIQRKVVESLGALTLRKEKNWHYPPYLISVPSRRTPAGGAKDFLRAHLLKTARSQEQDVPQGKKALESFYPDFLW